MGNENLYNRINEDDDMTDSERRDTYFSEHANDEAESQWQDEQCNW